MIIKIYSVLLAFIPILDLYQSFIPIISIGELLLIIFVGVLIFTIPFRKEYKITLRRKIQIQPIILVIAFVFMTLLAILMLNGQNIYFKDILNRFLRISLWSFSISILSYHFLDTTILKKYIVRISIIGGIYIFVQIISWYIGGVYLPSVISNDLIKPTSIGYADIQSMSSFYKSRFLRPGSFFAEPAFYSYYTLLALVLTLYDNDKLVKYKKMISIFITICIFLSTSTSGIYLTIFIWIYYGWKNKYKLDKNKFIKLTLSIILTQIVFLAIALYNINSFNSINNEVNSLEVIMSKPLKFMDSSRGGKSFKLFDKLEGVQKLIGVGLGNEDKYLGIEGYYNSITIILLSSGYIGIIIFLTFIYNTLKHKKNESFIIIIMYTILCFTSAILYSTISILYMSIVYYLDKNIESNKSCLTI